MHVFSAGLCILEAGILESVQTIYDKNNGLFSHEKLAILVKKFNILYREESLLSNFLSKMLIPDYTCRPSFADLSGILPNWFQTKVIIDTDHSRFPSFDGVDKINDNQLTCIPRKIEKKDQQNNFAEFQLLSNIDNYRENEQKPVDVNNLASKYNEFIVPDWKYIPENFKSEGLKNDRNVKINNDNKSSKNELNFDERNSLKNVEKEEKLHQTQNFESFKNVVTEISQVLETESPEMQNIKKQTLLNENAKMGKVNFSQNGYLNDYYNLESNPDEKTKVNDQIQMYLQSDNNNNVQSEIGVKESSKNYQKKEILGNVEQVLFDQSNNSQKQPFLLNQNQPSVQNPLKLNNQEPNVFKTNVNESVSSNYFGFDVNVDLNKGRKPVNEFKSGVSDIKEYDTGRGNQNEGNMTLSKYLKNFKN